MNPAGAAAIVRKSFVAGMVSGLVIMAGSAIALRVGAVTIVRKHRVRHVTNMALGLLFPVGMIIAIAIWDIPVRIVPHRNNGVHSDDEQRAGRWSRPSGVEGISGFHCPGCPIRSGMTMMI